MFFSKNLLGVDHCFFTKLGGVSNGKYSSLNCGKGSSDDRKKINNALKQVNAEVVSRPITPEKILKALGKI